MIKKDCTFPVLSLQEIVGCLNDLDIPCTELDLQKPSQHRILDLYSQFVAQFTPLSAGEFVFEMLDYPEIHSDSVQLLTLHKQFLQLFNRIGVEMFSLRDILKPEPQRVRHILSALINFCKFREEKLSVFETCTSKSQSLQDQLLSLQTRKAELEENIGGIKAVRLQEEPLVDKHKQTCAMLTGDLRDFKKQQQQISTQIETLKITKSELTEKMTNNDFLMNNLKTEIQRLRSRIVSNPEKLKQAIRDMNESLKQDKQTAAAAERKTRTLQSKIDMMNRVEQDIASCIVLLNEAQSAKEQHQLNAQKLGTERDSLERKESQLSELGLTEQLERQLNIAREKLVRLEKHQQSKQDVNEANLARLKADYQAASEDRNAAQLKVDENEAYIAELERQMDMFDQEHDQDMQTLKDEYLQLAEAVTTYQAQLSNTIR